jgi:hypothetical protein
MSHGYGWQYTETAQEFAKSHGSKRCPFELTVSCLGSQCWAFEVDDATAWESRPFDIEAERDQFVDENEGWYTGTTTKTDITPRRTLAQWFGFGPMHQRVIKSRYYACRDIPAARCIRLAAPQS